MSQTARPRASSGRRRLAPVVRRARRRRHQGARRGRSTPTAWCGTRSGRPRCEGVDGVVDGVVGGAGPRRPAGVAVEELAGVGIGLPGVVDRATGPVEHAVNLGIEERARSARSSPSGSGVPVRVENDLTVAASAPRTRRRARPSRSHDLAFLALGTGLAAGLLLEGRLRRGATGAAGEIGHLTLVPDGLPCKCGQAGLPGAVRLGLGARRRLARTARPAGTARAVRRRRRGRPAGDRGPRPVRVGGRLRGADPGADLRRPARRDRRRRERGWAQPLLRRGARRAGGRGAGLAVPRVDGAAPTGSASHPPACRSARSVRRWAGSAEGSF